MRRRRLLMFAVTIVGLVLVWPVLRSVYSELGDARKLSAWWIAAIIAAVAVQLVANWTLHRMVLRTDRWLDVAAPQLAGTAASRLLPGGNAIGAGLQVRMMAAAGFPMTRTVPALGALSVIGAVSGFVLLPIIVLVASAAGNTVESSLVGAMWLGAGVLLVLLIAIVMVAMRDGTWCRAARFVTAVQRRLRRPSDGPKLEQMLLEERDLIVRVLRARGGRILLLDLTRVLSDYLALYLSLRAVGAHVNPAAALAAFIVCNVAGMIPITPGGLGFVEAGLAGVLTLAGATDMQANLTVVTYRVAETWLPCLISVVAIVLFQRRHRERRLSELLTAPTPNQ